MRGNGGEGSHGIWIGAAAVIVAAIIGGIFALVAASRSSTPIPSTTTMPAPTTVATDTAATPTTGWDPPTTDEPTTSDGTPPSPARVD